MLHCRASFPSTSPRLSSRNFKFLLINLHHWVYFIILTLVGKAFATHCHRLVLGMLGRGLSCWGTWLFPTFSVMADYGATTAPPLHGATFDGMAAVVPLNPSFLSSPSCCCKRCFFWRQTWGRQTQHEWRRSAAATVVFSRRAMNASEWSTQGGVKSRIKLIPALICQDWLMSN